MKENVDFSFILPLPHVFGRGGSNCPVYTGLSLAAPAPTLWSDQWKVAAVEDTVVHVGPVKASPRADSYPADFNRRSPQTLSFQINPKF